MENPIQQGGSNLIEFAEQAIYTATGEHLNDLQQVILRESLQETKKTYEEIAADYNYSGNYIQQVVGPRLWRQLSKVFDQKVSKSNIRTVLLRKMSERGGAIGTAHARSRQNLTVASHSQNASLSEENNLEYPTDSVPLASPFYIEREGEPQCYQGILQPGALIRIKAPRQMGKTSLMQRMLAYAEKHDFTTITLNFQQAEQAILSDLNRFLRWISANLAKQLLLPPQLDDFWDDDIGSKMSCTLYVEGYLLEAVQKPIVLALEEVSELFDNQIVAQEFFTMLRTWHESTKLNENWQQLRLITVQSTESYIPLNINQSPFNVGLEIVLTSFSADQVFDLATRHGLHISPDETAQLCTLVNGHPHLVRLFLYHMAQQKTAFSDLMATALSDEGIYSNYLHRYLGYLQDNSSLKQAFQAVLSSSSPVEVEQRVAFQLQSLGLVNACQNSVAVSCDLYQSYFKARL